MHDIIEVSIRKAHQHIGWCVSSLAVAVFFILLTPSVVKAYTKPLYEQGSSANLNLQTQTFYKSKSPYVIERDCAVNVIPSYATITIEPGVVIKFKSNSLCGYYNAAAHLVVQGSLIANGTPTDPIIFTSWNDDVGGDTNGDGTATAPKKGDWGKLGLDSQPGATINITNAILRYGGGGAYVEGMVMITGAPAAVLQNDEFAFSGSLGIESFVPVTVTKSRFHDNAGGAIFSNYIYNPQIIATDNWWGDDSGPTTPSNPGGKGQSVWGNVIFKPWTGQFIDVGQRIVFSAGFESAGLSTSTIFAPSQPQFKVVYSDNDGSAPAMVNVVINSTTYAMVTTTQDTDYTKGVVYSFTSPTGTFTKGAYTYHFEASNRGVVTTSQDYIFRTKNIPVILIPGILGTELVKGNEILWMNLGGLVQSFDDSFMDPLIMNQDGSPSDLDVQVSEVIRLKTIIPKITFDYFDSLIKELEENSYVENQDLYVFPYDWRLDNAKTSQNLKNKIASILNQTGSEKVDIIAHSMGGLVAKRYVLDNGSGSVGKLVFIGTPHLGAPKAFKTILAGDTFGIPLVLNPLEMKKLGQNMSSVYQLLPSQKYVAEFGGYFYNSSAVPSDYQGTKAFLLNQGGNGVLLTEAENFHSGTMDDFNISGVAIYNITGCNTPTVGKIVKRNVYVEGGVEKADYDLEEVAGDGTVPFTSAIAVPATRRYYVVGASHSKMPSQDNVRQLVTQIITNKVGAGALPTGIRTDTTNCYINNGKLISVHSPVELHVYDSYGNHVGVDENGNIDETVPGATYEDIGTDKFIFVPEDTGQEYTVRLVATATSTFSLKISNLENNKVERTIFYRNIPILPASRGQIVLNAQSADTELEFDRTGTGNSSTIHASAVLDSVANQDYTKPTTSIALSGKLGYGGVYITPVTVELSAVDDNSGILTTEYSVDLGHSWNVYTGPVTVSSSGTTTIWYRSVDNAGNIEDNRVAVLSVMIDSTPPEAVITFDVLKKDVIVSGVDDQSDVAVNDIGDTVLITDAAGNSTTVRFDSKNRKEVMKGRLISIVYNGQQYNKINKNSFSIQWRYSKSGILQELEQSILVKNEFALHAEYDSKKNVTIVKGRDVETGKIKQKLNGLDIITIITKKGELSYHF